MNTAVKIMSVGDVQAMLAKCHGASAKGNNDGTRLHVHYTAMRKTPVTATAIAEAERADELGLQKDRFTGRINSVFTSKAGDTILNMMVELERDHKFRSLNVSKGQIHNLVVLGD